MFIEFFHQLKAASIPVTLKEYLTLMAAMDAERFIESQYN